jgi:predicted phosphoribosyltransferase
VGAEVARVLGAPLDVVLVRKLGVPAQPELAMGAIGENGVRVLNHEVLRGVGISESQLARVEERERAELERRAREYRGERGPAALVDRTAIIVDDGLATGSTARAAVEVVRALGARRVVLAVPVAPPETVAALERVADAVVAVVTPTPMWAIGAWYDNFAQTTDEEVLRLLDVSRRATGS